MRDGSLKQELTWRTYPTPLFFAFGLLLTDGSKGRQSWVALFSFIRDYLVAFIANTQLLHIGYRGLVYDSVHWRFSSAIFPI
jgi:hypothetical protein